MIELRNVTKRFGKMTAVDDVCLRVEPGEFLTLLGPSGCGKTTMLRMISGFETPTVGSVHLDDVEVTHQPPYRREVNQVFQSYALFPHLSVAGNVAFGLKVKGVAKAEIATRVTDALAMVALDGLADRKPAQLSGGQRQRVALARAVVNRPKVLLLDEPLSALDAKLRQQTRVELKQLQTRLGITFVFVTHDQDEALGLSDRVAVVNKGRIEQLASPREIYDRPATRFVATFVGETNLIHATIDGSDRRAIFLSPRLRVRSETSCEPASGSNPASGSISVSIRPEAVRIETDVAVSDDNHFPATIESVEFRGATESVRVRTADDLILTSLLADPRPFTIGERVTCRIAPKDVIVLRDDI